MPALLERATENLHDPITVKKLALDSNNRNPDPTGSAAPSWKDLSLASGYPSLLLLFSTLKRDETLSHSYVLKIKEAIEKEGLFDLSLFSGVAGICFALKQASHEGARYQKILSTLHTYLLGEVETSYFEFLRYNQQKGLPSSPRLYDPVQGICGIGRYALENLSIPSFAKLAEDIVKAVICLSWPLNYKGNTIPGWYLLPTDALNIKQMASYPKGNFNLGLAHGVTGILAFLAIASLKGVQVEGQRDAMFVIASWIRNRSFDSNGTIVWPYSVSWEEEVQGEPCRREMSKEAWCYGVPGIARTLFLAAKALNDAGLKAFAIQAFQGIFQRPQTSWQIPGPALCHGTAGLFLITREMAKEDGCEDLIPKAALLKELLLSYYDETAVWGFQDVELCRNGKACKINKPGFLEGAAGILMALNDELDPLWHLPLMIYG